MKDGILSWRDDKMSKLRTQDTDSFFYDAGQFYLARKNHLLESMDFISGRSIGLIIEELEGVDIDTMHDFKFAEKIYKLNE